LIAPMDAALQLEETNNYDLSNEQGSLIQPMGKLGRKTDRFNHSTHMEALQLYKKT